MSVSSFLMEYHVQVGIGMLVVAGIIFCILIATFKSVWLSDNDKQAQQQSQYANYVAQRQAKPKSGMRRFWGGNR